MDGNGRKTQGRKRSDNVGIGRVAKGGIYRVGNGRKNISAYLCKTRHFVSGEMGGCWWVANGRN